MFVRVRMLRILRIMKYKFFLDKSSKKFICPLCQKKTFVKYVNSFTQGYLETALGRCDRESKCGYHVYPKDNKPIVSFNHIIDIPEPSCHNDPVLSYFGNNHAENQFIIYLLQYFVLLDVKNAIKKYFIGTSNH